jgi:hypothetical protein
MTSAGCATLTYSGCVAASFLVDRSVAGAVRRHAIDSLRSALYRFDISAVKKVRINERANVEFRAEF